MPRVWWQPEQVMSFSRRSKPATERMFCNVTPFSDAFFSAPTTSFPLNTGLAVAPSLCTRPNSGWRLDGSNPAGVDAVDDSGQDVPRVVGINPLAIAHLAGKGRADTDGVIGDDGTMARHIALE